MLRFIAPICLLLLTPAALAETVCVGDTTVACAIVEPDDRFSWYGVDAYDSGSGAFVSAGYGEGSGFFADTATAMAFGYAAPAGQWAVFVIALNDYDRDGTYEDVGVYAGAWNDDASMPAVGQGFYTALP